MVLKKRKRTNKKPLKNKGFFLYKYTVLYYNVSSGGRILGDDYERY